MRRRTFIRSLGTTAVAGKIPTTVSATPDSSPVKQFIDKFGLAVASFFDEDWDSNQLAENVSEAIEFICYSYGVLDDEEAKRKYNKERGFLSEFNQYSVEHLVENEGFLNWFQKNLSEVVDLLDGIDVLSEPLVTMFEEAIGRVDRVTKYIPLIGCLKGLLETGCSLHANLERDGKAKPKAYIKFFKNVALVAVEIVLLAAGFSAAYRVAYGATGWVNRQLIYVVGRSIGWRAYSWVLSQIHWGIRVAFAEVSNLAIKETVEEVTSEIIKDANRHGVQLSEREVKRWVREDVESIAVQSSDMIDKWRLQAELLVENLLADLPYVPFI